MNARHEARTLAVQFLFQRDFNAGDEIPPALQEFWSERKAGRKVREFAEQLIHGVEARRPELDATLQEFADNWDVRRMGAVDRNVMRVALFEMLYCPEIPGVVSINEAVDLAKELSSVESGRFVNGILDRAFRTLKAAPRAAGSPGTAT